MYKKEENPIKDNFHDIVYSMLVEEHLSNVMSSCSYH